MWPLNSQNIPNISNIQQKILPSDQTKNNIPDPIPLYQTPIKQSLNIQRSNDTPPLQFDFNFYFGNLWSSGHLPQHFETSMNNSVTQNNREANMLLFKSSMEKSRYKLTPMSEVKNINNSNLIEYGLNNNYPNTLNNIYENDLNHNEFTKKNLAELFNNAKNDEFLPSNKKTKKKKKRRNNYKELLYDSILEHIGKKEKNENENSIQLEEEISSLDNENNKKRRKKRQSSRTK